MKNLFAGILTNTRAPLSPPTFEVIYKGIPSIEQAADNMLAGSFIGDKEKIRRELEPFIEELQIDELMAISYIYDDAKCLESFSILKDALAD